MTRMILFKRQREARAEVEWSKKESIAVPELIFNYIIATDEHCFVCRCGEDVEQAEKMKCKCGRVFHMEEPEDEKK